MTALYATTMFVSALLLFWVQPMFTKSVLPLLGGSPAVWNTALVFFQAALLAGYLYVHLTSRWLRPGRQALVHLVLVVAAALWLPLGIPEGWTPPAGVAPVPWLLALLGVAIGLPFFVLSATAPLLQRWFATTDHPLAYDPYFLYSASNVGSLLALVAYPLLVEPMLGLEAQGWLWAVGYAGFGALLIGCALRLRGGRQAAPRPAERIARPEPPAAKDRPRVGWKGPLLWIALSFIPSSLLLSVTTHISTNIAVVPLLWVVPLALYLLTFVIAFARRPPLRHRWMAAIYPWALLGLAVTVGFETLEPRPPVFFLIHLAGFFLIAMGCHGALVERRPSAAGLTGFYLWISLGGVLGGAFNALAAPIVFETVLEYPITIALAILISPVVRGRARPIRLHEGGAKKRLAWAGGAALAAVLVLLILGTLEGRSNVGLGITAFAVLTGVAIFAAPSSLRLGVGAVLFVLALGAGVLSDPVVARERSFFGVNTVKLDDAGDHRLLYHGTTVHGAQKIDDEGEPDPLAYYGADGPAGQLFDRLGREVDEVGVVGLGSGALACHRRPGQRWTFYEIDPAVRRIARNAAWFSYLEACAPAAEIIMGDARISLREEPDRFDLLVLDAFSSDAIPIHLMTREAIELYLSRLDRGGVLAFHISNRYLNLKPVLATLIDDMGLAGRVQWYGPDLNRISREHVYPSEWVIVARSEDELAFLEGDERWNRLDGVKYASLWTDDFSNILGLIRWAQF